MSIHAGHPFPTPDDPVRRLRGRLGGTVSGVANMGVMLGGMFMQPLVGWVLDRHWTGALSGGVRVYDYAAYRSAFALMLVWGALALVLLAFTRETYCRQAR